MAQNNLLQLILDGSAPKNLRALIARGAAPIATREALELLVLLVKDPDREIATQAERTLASLDKEEIVGYLKTPSCAHAVLEYFAQRDPTDAVLHAIISNPAAPGKTIESIALSAPAHLLDRILDNRVRIIEFPAILENVKKNPQATPDVCRLVQEIEVEFFGDKKKEYAIEDGAETADSPTQAPLQDQALQMESEIPFDDLTLEGLPVDADAREAELAKRISSLSVQEKIKRALFGNREIRAILVRDTNREVARSVLRSPKLTENEIESIACMRGVTEDILRDIGNSREWTRSYMVVQNLIRNPKTPPVISQRLLFRLHTRDLLMLTKDRSIPDVVRQNATRSLNQRTKVSQ
jgi:hypothetical protein